MNINEDVKSSHYSKFSPEKHLAYKKVEFENKFHPKVDLKSREEESGATHTQQMSRSMSPDPIKDGESKEASMQQRVMSMDSEPTSQHNYQNMPYLVQNNFIHDDFLFGNDIEVDRKRLNKLLKYNKLPKLGWNEFSDMFSELSHYGLNPNPNPAAGDSKTMTRPAQLEGLRPST
jgi:hypothetical protein